MALATAELISRLYCVVSPRIIFIVVPIYHLNFDKTMPEMPFTAQCTVYIMLLYCSQ